MSACEPPNRGATCSHFVPCRKVLFALCPEVATRRPYRRHRGRDDGHTQAGLRILARLPLVVRRYSLESRFCVPHAVRELLQIRSMSRDDSASRHSCGHCGTHRLQVPLGGQSPTVQRGPSRRQTRPGAWQIQNTGTTVCDVDRPLANDCPSVARCLCLSFAAKNFLGTSRLVVRHAWQVINPLTPPIAVTFDRASAHWWRS